MGWIRGLVSATWFRYAIFGALAAATVVFGYGYLKGYAKAEAVYQVKINNALASQLKWILEVKEKELHLALKAEREKNAISRKINQVARPTNSCELPAPCLQWYDNILRASATN